MSRRSPRRRPSSFMAGRTTRAAGVTWGKRCSARASRRRAAARLLPCLRLPLPSAAAAGLGRLRPHPAVNEAYQRDPVVHRVMTPGAWREIRWAQRSVVADANRIECPLLFLLAGEDRVVDAQLARAFADGLRGPVQVRWYPEMYHEILNDPQRDRVMGDIVAFLSPHGLA